MRYIKCVFNCTTIVFIVPISFILYHVTCGWHIY